MRTWSSVFWEYNHFSYFEIVFLLLRFLGGRLLVALKYVFFSTTFSFSFYMPRKPIDLWVFVLHHKFTFLVVFTLLLNGCFLISLKEVREERVQFFRVDDYDFGNVENITLGWRERLYWFTRADSGDKICFSWNADGNVRVYILTKTQFQNFMSNGCTVYCEYFAEFYCGVAKLTLVNSDEYYVVIENQSPSPCKIKMYEAECKLLKTYVAVETRTAVIYPFRPLGIILMFVAVLRAMTLICLKR